MTKNPLASNPVDNKIAKHIAQKIDVNNAVPSCTSDDSPHGSNFEDSSKKVDNKIAKQRAQKIDVNNAVPSCTSDDSSGDSPHGSNFEDQRKLIFHLNKLIKRKVALFFYVLFIVFQLCY
jgi:hypothetical protein